MKKNEQDLTWSDVMWAWIQKGVPREEAVFQADEFMRRRERERNTGSRRRARAFLATMEKTDG